MTKVQLKEMFDDILTNGTQYEMAPCINGDFEDYEIGQPFTSSSIFRKKELYSVYKKSSGQVLIDLAGQSSSDYSVVYTGSESGCLEWVRINVSFFDNYCFNNKIGGENALLVHKALKEFCKEIKRYSFENSHNRNIDCSPYVYLEDLDIYMDKCLTSLAQIRK